MYRVQTRNQNFTKGKELSQKQKYFCLKIFLVKWRAEQTGANDGS